MAKAEPNYCAYLFMVCFMRWCLQLMLTLLYLLCMHYEYFLVFMNSFSVKSSWLHLFIKLWDGETEFSFCRSPWIPRMKKKVKGLKFDNIFSKKSEIKSWAESLRRAFSGKVTPTQNTFGGMYLWRREDIHSSLI